MSMEDCGNQLNTFSVAFEKKRMLMWGRFLKARLRIY